MSRLLRSQQQAKSHHYYYCLRCLRAFSAKHVLLKHEALCRRAANRPTCIEMPEVGRNTLKFQNQIRQMKVPYVIYFDFEANIVKYDTCKPSPNISSTTNTEVHEPCSYSMIAVRSDGEHKKLILY